MLEPSMQSEEIKGRDKGGARARKRESERVNSESRNGDLVDIVT